METQTANRTARAGWCLIAVAAVAIALSFFLDAPAQSWLASHQNHAVRGFMKTVSAVGDWPAHVALGIIMLALATWRRNRRWQRIFISLLVACALAGIVARVVKIGTGRARPSVKTESVWNGPRFNSKYHAFPSGHTAASAAFFAALAFASWRVGVVFLSIPLLIAFSRMYVAAHYLSDVVFAAFLGVACAFVTALWFRKLAVRDASVPEIA